MIHARKAYMHAYSSSFDADRGDYLTELLLGLRLDGVDYGRFELRAPWGLDVPAQRDARFHFIGGPCWMRGPDGEWQALARGDAVLMPRGARHTLASAPDAPLGTTAALRTERLCGNIYDVCDDAPAGAATVLFSGSLRFNVDPLHPLLGMMPDTMRIDALNAKEPAVPQLLCAMAREVNGARVGSAGLLARLADVLAAFIIRNWVEDGCGSTAGWIAAVRHPEIGKVLAALHRDPGRGWTVDMLARVMGASRSRFAQRFAEVVGETPARYLAQVRMHQARLWLTRDGLRVSDVARRLGYESDAAFSRAFKRTLGESPGHARSGARATAAPPTAIGARVTP